MDKMFCDISCLPEGEIVSQLIFHRHHFGFDSEKVWSIRTSVHVGKGVRVFKYHHVGCCIVTFYCIHSSLSLFSLLFTLSEGPEYEYSGSEEEDDEVTEEEGEPR